MNYQTTCLGGGFDQAVNKSYSHTNGNNQDPRYSGFFDSIRPILIHVWPLQLGWIYKNQEAIALIHMMVNQSDQAHRSVAEAQSSEETQIRETNLTPPNINLVSRQRNGQHCRLSKTKRKGISDMTALTPRFRSPSPRNFLNNSGAQLWWAEQTSDAHLPWYI
jgi:hypothetical protein